MAARWEGTSGRPLGDHYEFAARAVRSVTYVFRSIAMRDQTPCHFVLAAKSQRRIRDHGGVVNEESVCVPERDKRQAHRRNLQGPLDRSAPRCVQRNRSGLSRPLLPGSAFGTSGLKHKVPTRAQRCMHTSECLRPAFIGHEDLRHVARHHREVGGRRRQLCRVAMHPGDLLRSILPPCDRERCLGWVHGDHAATAPGEQHRQRTRPAANVEDAFGSEFIGQVEVGRQVVSLAVKCIVDRCEARMGEDRIRHAAQPLSGGGRTTPNPRNTAAFTNSNSSETRPGRLPRDPDSPH
jgi:hypothetical protein